VIRTRPLPPSPLAARAEAAAAPLSDDAVAVWGGIGPTGRPLGDGAILRLDPLAWEPIPPAPILPRADPGVAAAAGTLVVWGGKGRNDGAAYDAAPGSWSELPPTPLEPRVNHVLHAVEGSLLVWGGDDGSPAPPGPHAYVDGAALDLASATWSPVAPFPLPPRAFPSRVWYDHRLVVWGGVDEVADGAPGRAPAPPARLPAPPPPADERRDAALYDAATSTWTVLPPPPLLSAPSRALVARGGVLLLGLDGAVVEWEPSSGRVSAATPLPSSAGLAEPGVVVSTVNRRALVLVPEGEALRAWSDAGGAWQDEGIVESPGRAGAAIAVTERRLVLWGGFVRGSGFAADGMLVSLEPCG
jgi:hypothetical protein